jgi:preprotein translocase subunit YajC
LSLVFIILLILIPIIGNERKIAQKESEKLEQIQNAEKIEKQKGIESTFMKVSLGLLT